MSFSHIIYANQKTLKAQLKYHNHPFSSDFLSKKSSLSPLIILTFHSRYLLMLIVLGTILLCSVFFVEAKAVIYVSLCIQLTSWTISQWYLAKIKVCWKQFLKVLKLCFSIFLISYKEKYQRIKGKYTFEQFLA